MGPNDCASIYVTSESKHGVSKSVSQIASQEELCIVLSMSLSLHLYKDSWNGLFLLPSLVWVGA